MRTGGKHSRNFLMLGLCAFSLMGCTAATLLDLDTSAYGIFSREDVNLAQKNYAAADFLIQQAHTFIRGHDLVQALPLSDAQQPGMSSQIGKMIPEQIGIRLSQLGYAMDLSEVTTAPDTNFLKPSTVDGRRKPRFTLSGTYLRRSQDLDISLRIIDLTSSRVVGAFDYSLPMSNEIADFSEPQARIFKIQK